MRKTGVKGPQPREILQSPRCQLALSWKSKGCHLSSQRGKFTFRDALCVSCRASFCKLSTIPHSSLNDTFSKSTKKIIGIELPCFRCLLEQGKQHKVGIIYRIVNIGKLMLTMGMDGESLIPSAAPLHRPGLKIWTVMVSVTPLRFVGISVSFSGSCTLCESTTTGQLNAMV